MTFRSACLLALCLMLLPDAAFAQRQTAPSARPPLRWGVIGSFAPWTADNRFKVFYDARTLDFAGDEVRFGIARGSTRRGEFAFLYVKKRIDEGSTLTDLNHRTFVIGPEVYVTGFMAEQFVPFGTIARTVQIGFVMAAGAGKAHGHAISVADDTAVDAHRVLRVFAQPREFQPLARAELAIAVAAAPGTKLRFSGGFDWPGSTKLSVSAMYFFGD
jgi:hypothetical protein